jgi:hypothetical protein
MLDVQWDLEYALQLQQTALHKEAHVGDLHSSKIWNSTSVVTEAPK